MFFYCNHKVGLWPCFWLHCHSYALGPYVWTPLFCSDSSSGGASLCPSSECVSREGGERGQGRRGVREWDRSRETIGYQSWTVSRCCWLFSSTGVSNAGRRTHGSVSVHGTVKSPHLSREHRTAGLIHESGGCRSASPGADETKWEQSDKRDKVRMDFP